MDKVYEELDDAKAEIEKLRSEHRVKADLCDNLKRSHNEQLKRIQELNLKLEKQDQELNANADEIYTAKQALEDLNCKLREKECVIKSLIAANDKLRIDSDTKLQKCEEEKRELVLSLEEENVKNLDLEQKNRALIDEIEVLREGLFSVSQKKCSDANKMAKASKEMRQRGDMLEKVEEENVKLEEQLKWKKEQFKHLEEAHEKLRDNLRKKEKEWDLEKCTLLDEISMMESKLDSQIRLSEDLQRRLEMCNQALSHEETRRKDSVVQLSESRSHFDVVFSECEEAKTKLESLTSERDKDVRFLRNLLDEKETVCKEMEYRIGKLEDENQELKYSLKELREYQIQEASSSSVAKIRNKLKTLEQIHRDCLARSKVNEVEWSSRYEKLAEELNSCRCELERKEALLEEFRQELEDCNSLVLQLSMEKEESVIMALAMQSAVMEAKSKIEEENVLVLMKELGTKNSELVKAQESVGKHRAKVESLKLVEEEKLLLQKEVESQKEQLLQAKSELTEVCDSLDRANEELALSFCEVNEAEFELNIWKSVAEKLELKLEQSQRMRRELESSLLAQVAIEVSLKEENNDLVHSVEEKNQRVEDLQQKLVLLEDAMRKRSKKDSLSTFAKENGEELEKEIVWLEQEWLTKELEGAILAQLESEKIHEHEKKSLNQLVEEKEHRINDLQQIMRSLEEEFDHSTTSFSSQLSSMQAEISLFHEKITTAFVLQVMDIQYKDMMIEELEKDLNCSLELQDECLISVKKLSSEKERLMGIIGDASDRISKFSREDKLLMRSLSGMVLISDENSRKSMDLQEGVNDTFDPSKENTNAHPSPKRKTVGSNGDGRSPLRALND